jgi:hypothetical protein
VQARLSAFLSLVSTVLLFMLLALPAFAGDWGENWGEMVWGVPEPNADLAGMAALLTIGLLCRRWRAGLLVLGCFIGAAGFAEAQDVTIPHTFENGQVADASEVNENFQGLSNALDVTVPNSFSNGEIADADQVNDNFISLEEGMNAGLQSFQVAIPNEFTNSTTASADDMNQNFSMVDSVLRYGCCSKPEYICQEDCDYSFTEYVGSTAPVLCDFTQNVINDDESVQATSSAQWSCALKEELRSLVANGIPDHIVGTFPNANNPTAISEQSVAVDFPLFPIISNEAGTPTQVVAYAINGVKFEVGTAGTCTDAGDCSPIGNGGAWSMEAVGESSFDFGNDDSNGHVQPTGTYHYHGMPEGLLTRLGQGASPTLVGFAVDGFPIYARYGYTTADDASSDVVVLDGSYQLKSSPDTGRPGTAIYPMGAFTQDWEYVAGSGDLDECNGRVGVTPEFPNGIYHYYLTDTFPFGQRCVKGDAIGGGGTGPPSCDTVPAGLPCCGDSICGGPETAQNCSVDCS